MSSKIEKLERRAGIEPASLAWKARVIASIRTPRSNRFIGINEQGLISKGIFVTSHFTCNSHVTLAGV